MQLDTLRELLERVARGTLDSQSAFEQLAAARSETIDGATIDLGRTQRCGLPEVIYGAGKPASLIREVAERILGDGNSEVLVTRLNLEHVESIVSPFSYYRYHPIAKTLRLSHRPIPAVTEQRQYGPVAVITAGSTDQNVADEAIETLAWMEVTVVTVQDVGVAGPQRLLQALPRIRACRAAVVAAGMEGALPSAVAGHVGYPVIAVPTSVGYGAAFGGLAALLAMLTSCAANVSVVNIDAGFKAGYIAGLIARGATKTA